jgi:CRISPR-associated protein Cas1
MAFRHVVITKPSNIKIKDQQLVIVQDDTSPASIPLEDIISIIIEDNRSIISSHALSECMAKDIVVFFCDSRHIPSGIALPFQNHVRQFSRLKQQIQLKKPFKKRIWQQLIIRKIKNQSLALKFTDQIGEVMLEKLSETVASGDQFNVEAVAAKHYFTLMFGTGFTRNSLHPINTLLDYGYSIVRGAVARSLAAYGFIPSLGIHHRNEFNNFNLADDFIEPFRPIVDLNVFYSVNSVSLELNPSMKVELINSLNQQILLENKKISLVNAIDTTIKSFVTSIEKQDSSSLLLPQLVPLKMHKYE